MKLIILMIQFFTRIPINTQMEVHEEDFAKAVVYLPIVGVLIGAINVVAYQLLSLLLPASIVMVLVTLINVYSTGAFHVDGLADTYDGIFSGRSKEAILEIMRDSRIGTHGTGAIFFDFVLRIACLQAVSEAHIVQALMVTPILSRTMLTILMSFSSYARAGTGLGSLFIGQVTTRQVGLTLMVGGLLAIFIMGNFAGVLLIALNILCILLYRHMIIAKIDGMTGDTLGAGNEISEVASLLLIVMMEKWVLL